MSVVRRYRITIASVVVLLIAAASLVAYAFAAQGYPVRHVNLNDGGVWVTSNKDGLFGRLNKPAGALDAGINPPGAAAPSAQLDVLQDGAAVAAWDKSAKLWPVDVRNAKAAKDQGATIPASFQVQMAGGTLAVLDPASGKVWAIRADPSVGLTSLAPVDPSTIPLGTVGSSSAGHGAALAVAVDGSIHVAAASGKSLSIAPAGMGFGKPISGSIGAALPAIQLTTVGSEVVAFDAGSGTLVLPNGKTLTVDHDAAARLQQPSASRATVVIATSKQLLSVSLSDGKIETLFGNGAGAPASPTWLGSCVHSAWAGTPGIYVRSCDGRPASNGNLQQLSQLQSPVFRVNRNLIVLNDTATGSVWDLETHAKVDNWAAVKPPSDLQSNDKNQNSNQNVSQQDQPPKAVPDVLGARPGRATVLHVLDNDSDPQGYILSIKAVTTPDVTGAVLAISPDGQTVQIQMPSGSGEVHFNYTVDAGDGLTATAAVTVQARGPADNKLPAPRVGYTPPQLTVASGGTIVLPVISDWRDFDGDSLILRSTSTAPGGGVATPAPDGRISYLAPVAAGVQTINYQIWDGVGDPVTASLPITVAPANATATTPAKAEPDVARGQVGQPVVIHPLDNDLPGSDPTSPNATLALAGALPSPANTTVQTDLASGTVTFTAARAGVYQLAYNAAYGNAAFAAGTIRVDIIDPPPAPLPPVAMPDTAVVYGQNPATVDVLANDFDPAGAMLAVQNAQPVDPAAGLQIAVVQGHWLRINALSATPLPGPQLVRYTITDGLTSPVSGQVTVTQLPLPAKDTPITVDDKAIVRAGDSVLVPVLDNDYTVAGSPLTLLSNVPNAPTVGQLPVTTTDGKTDNVGSAYVTGNLVRYIPPASVTTPTTVIVTYVAQDSTDTASGHLKITIIPAPTPATPDQPPTPKPIEVRTTAGDTVTIAMPTTMVDPDGDSVTVTGLSAPASLGRIIKITATSLVYQAYPTSAGTDTFAYQVMDQYGKTGTATIRVAIAAPGVPQPPVAVDDQITAAPGATVSADVQANDLRSPDDAVSIEPLTKTNPSLTGGAKLASDLGPITVTAPPADGKPVVVLYGLTDGTGTPSIGKLTVRSVPKFNNPPVAFDAFAQPTTAKTVTVEVLAKDSDPDGDSTKLKVSKVFVNGSSVAGGKVTLPVLDHPQAVPYQITDEGGATSVAVIHVPAAGTGAPYVKDGQTIRVDKNATAAVDITKYVTDPAGKPVRLTIAERTWASPAAGLKLTVTDATHLSVTGLAGYVGPAAVTFEVTDGTTASDPKGSTAIVTIPVQVGPETPVLRCPTSALSVVEGGQDLSLDISSVCHVWVAQAGSASSLNYTATWKQPITDVKISGSGSQKISLTAAGSAKPGAAGILSISVAGTAAIPAELPISVVAAVKPSITPVVIDGFKASDTATVDIAGYLTSQLRDPVPTVVSITQTSGMASTQSSNGSTISIKPGSTAHGVLTFDVVVSDVKDKTRTDRQVTGRITLNVLNVPDAPGTPTPDRSVVSHVVQLSWPTPASNGAPIDYYQVNWSGGSLQCAASPCTISGLTNGTQYNFTVKAHNVVGLSQPSPASPNAQPNAVPDAVTNLTQSNPQDGSLTLTWSPAHVDGTPVSSYVVSWGGGSRTVDGATTTMVAAGLQNDSQYTFNIAAVNQQGPGPATTVSGQSSGRPPTMAAPTFTNANDANRNSRAVTLAWAADDPNGISPTTYTVTRTGGGGSKTLCPDTQATSCIDSGLANDGTVYQYSVTAKNGAAAADPGPHTSSPSPALSVEATATPDQITITNVTVDQNTPDGQAKVTFNVGASHGASATVKCNGGACGSMTLSSTVPQSGLTMTATNLPVGQSASFTLTECNGSKQSDAAAGNACNAGTTASARTNGPPYSAGGLYCGLSGTVVTYGWAAPASNGRPFTYTLNGEINLSGYTNTNAQKNQPQDGQTRTVGVTTVDSAGERSQTVYVMCPDAAPPPPPPPSPSVVASNGATCNGATCSASSPAACTSSSCAFIHVVTANFAGSVTCTFNSSRGNVGFVNEVYGANESKDSWNFFGQRGGWVQVTCGGVASNQFVWP